MTPPSNKTSPPLTISVLGGGSFGTALSNIIAENGHTIKQWVRSDQQAQEINTSHTNHRYFHNFSLHPSIKAVTDIRQAVQNATLVFLAIPSQYFRHVIRQLKGCVTNKMLISTAKGIETSTFNLMSEIIQEELPEARIGALSGPNLANEIIRQAITATVIASEDEEICAIVPRILQRSYLRIYTSQDLFGVQLGGALKNIYAIAAGMASCIETGENTRSLLITHSLLEMSRFAVTLGASPATLLGLSGIGDLIVTCSSTLSRNFRLGQAIGLGDSVANAEHSLGQIAEGLNTLRLVKKKAEQLNIYMPIVTHLYAVIFEGDSVTKMIQEGILGEPNNNTQFLLNH